MGSQASSACVSADAAAFETGSLQVCKGLGTLCEQAIASQGRAQKTWQVDREESSLAPPATGPPSVAGSTTCLQCGFPPALGVCELVRVPCVSPLPPWGERGAFRGSLFLLSMLDTLCQHRARSVTALHVLLHGCC